MRKERANALSHRGGSVDMVYEDGKEAHAQRILAMRPAESYEITKNTDG